MKICNRKFLLAVALLSILNPQPYFAQGSAFTYAGRLNDNGVPANGSYDLTFSLFTQPSNGLVLAPTLTNRATVVSDGLFTVVLDFGAAGFPGAERWLGISVRTNGGGAFTTLSPRQQITAAPYAINPRCGRPHGGFEDRFLNPLRTSLRPVSIRMECVAAEASSSEQQAHRGDVFGRPQRVQHDLPRWLIEVPDRDSAPA